MSSVKSRKNEQGIAILTVITVLVALMVIAVPFAISMRLGYERSVQNNARVKAKRQVDSTMRFLEAVLVKTTERVESENRLNKSTDINNNPEKDTFAEFTPSKRDMADALGVSESELEDAYGTILGYSVEDENGKLNINTASFFAIGNLLGLSMLTAEMSEGSSSITLENAADFPERGYVKIGREVVKYSGKEGNRLVGCERSKPEAHKADDWVVNYAAWAIAYYAVGRHPGEATSFDTLDVTDISQLPGSDLDTDVPVITQADWDRVSRFFTAWSKGDVIDGWANVQPVVEGTALPSEEEGFDKFQFVNSAYYNLGTIVRIGEKAETNIERRGIKKVIRPRRYDYAMVFDARPAGRYLSELELFGKVHRTFTGNQMRVQYRTRHPVNVNTAPREVLVALFAHLRLKSGSKGDRVTREEAEKVADEIIRLRKQGPDSALGGMEDFHDMLGRLTNESQSISVHDRRAIHRNALNSHDQDLEFGTVPICFHTFDVYTLRATATICDLGGRLLAKHSATRVVEIGSQLTASRLWETQRDFEEQLIASQDPRNWTTGPINTGQILSARPIVQPWYRWPKQLNRHVFPRDPYSVQQEKAFEQIGRDSAADLAANGDIRLAPARMEFDDTQAGSVFVEHFDNDDYVEGHFSDSGYALEGGLEGSVLDAIFNGRVRPFGLQFWWQSQQGNSGDVTIFDCGESEFRNRYTCYVDSSSNELVFAVADNTDTQRACELRYDLGRARL